MTQFAKHRVFVFLGQVRATEACLDYAPGDYHAVIAFAPGTTKDEAQDLAIGTAEKHHWEDIRFFRSGELLSSESLGTEEQMIHDAYQDAKSGKSAIVVFPEPGDRIES